MCVSCAQCAELPASVFEIRAYAFSGNTSLQSVVIPYGTTSIGEHAFDGSGIRRIHIPETVQEMGEGVFENCVNELDISVEPESYAQHWCEDNDIQYRFLTSPEKFTVSFNGTYKDGTYTITYCGICGYTGHDEIVYVPEGINGYPVTMIQDSAFLGAEFTEIIFPKTV